MKVHVFKVVEEVVVDLNSDIYSTPAVAMKVALKVAQSLLDAEVEVRGGKDDGAVVPVRTAQSVDPDGVLEWEAERLERPGCELVATIPEGQ